ncbi:uncharacterized protein UMAG_10403 [Mycosarcoma maydis]|uniref:Uncharacterized protein n=1 Tax=Mycosarcoma maydis TaxID=5270 RepID=A0A0D1CPU9_MYCMD|nr:uncharacterized protein UMAG_10403 [Ustilago maydis 521]KIS68628.1 hypothetical protein UMAG_10403 [Ustilago maydis 521]|eukprot:XP_011389789.1 hypothetical protein UMAG_10403 [Ustilago maydis 521]
MKLTTSLLALGALLVGTASTEAAAVERPGPWSEIHHKNSIKHFKMFAAPSGSDLRSQKPVYDKCDVKFPSNKDYMYKYFADSHLLEFQKLGRHTVGINCPSCSPQEAGNLYLTKFNVYFECRSLDQRTG